MEDTVSGYAVVIEQADGNLSAYVPDLPGCVATGLTESEVRSNIAEAIRLHVESLRAHGEPVPPPTSTTATLDA
jgi:predicted RNase H-like HicB family nuclease